MLGNIWSLIKAIPAIVGLIRSVISIGYQIARLFEKSPVDEQAKKEKEHAESDTKAEAGDDTSGGFGG